MVDTPDDKVVIEVEADATQVANAAAKSKQEFEGLLRTLGAVESKINKMFGSKLPAQLKDLQALIAAVQNAPNPPADMVRQANQAARSVNAGGQIRNQLQRQISSTLKDSGLAQEVALNKELVKAQTQRLDLYRRIRAAGDGDELFSGQAYIQYLRQLGDAPKKGNEAFRAWKQATENELATFNARLAQEETVRLQKAAQQRLAISQDTLRRERKLQEDHQSILDKLFRKDLGAIMSGKTPQERAALARTSISNLQGYAGRRGITGFDPSRLTSIYDDAEGARFVRDQVKQRDADARELATKQRQADLDLIKAKKEASAAVRQHMVAEAENRKRDLEEHQRQFNLDRKLADAENKRRQTIIAQHNEAWEMNRKRDQAWDDMRSMADRMNFDFDARKAKQADKEKSSEERRRQKIEQDRARRRTPEAMADRLTARAELAVDYGAMGLAAYAIGSSIRNAIELQKSLKQLQAISGATATEMSVLQQTVLNVGNATNFTNTQIADTATLLAQAGFSASQINSALPAIANLATATGASLQDAAQSVTSILTVFSLGADQTQQVSNKLASALNSSKLDFAQLALGIQYAANTSADAGLSFEEMTSALGAMSNAGIKSGSTLGTGLRNVIESLENPSTKFVGYLDKMGLSAADVDVKSVGLTDALKTLSERGFSATDAIEAFGQRAGSAYAALVPNLGALDAMQKAMLDSTAATDGAATQMDSFSAQATRASNAMTQLVLVAGGPALGAVQVLMGGFADLTTAALQATPAVQAVFTLGASGVAAGGIVWAGKLALGLLNIKTAADVAAISTLGFRGAIAAAWTAMGPIGWTVLGLTAGFTALTYALGGAKAYTENLNREVETYKSKANEAQAESSKYSSRVEELNRYVERLTNQHGRLSEQVNGASKEADLARRRFGDWGLSLDGVGGNVDRLTERVIKLRSEMALAAAEQARLNVENLQKERDAAAKTNQVGQRELTSGPILASMKALSPRAQDVLRRMRSGSASAEDIEFLRPELQRYLKQRPGDAQMQRIAAGLSGLGTSRLAQIDAQLAVGRQTVGTSTVQASASTTSAANRLKNYVNYYNGEKAQIAKEKDPTRKQERSLALRQWLTTSMPKIQGILGDATKNNLQLPDVQGLREDQVRQTIADMVPGYSTLYMNSLPADLGTNKNAVASSLKALKAELALARKKVKKSVDPRAKEQIPLLEAQIRKLEERKVLLDNPDDDPLVVQDLLNSTDRRLDASNASAALGGSGARGDRQSRQEAKTLTAQIKDLERKIGIAAGRLTAEQASSPDGRASLVSMVDQRNKMVADQIRKEGEGSGAGDSEIRERIAAAQSEMDDFKKKIVEGTIQDALDLLAQTANRRADDTSASEQNLLREGRGNLDVSLTKVRDDYAKALEADLAVIAKKFEIDPNDRRQKQEEADARAQNLRQRVDAAIQTIEAYAEGQTRAIEKALLNRQTDIARRQADLDRTSETLSAFGLDASVLDRSKKVLSRDALGARMIASRDTLSLQEDRLANYRSQLASTTDPQSIKSLADKIKASEDAAAGLRTELAQSSIEYENLNRQAMTFSDLAAAARDALQAQRENGTNTIKAAFVDQLPDAFGKVSGSFTTMLDNLVSGTQSAKASVKDFAVSILGTLKDMAVKIAAQKILFWVLSKFAPGGGKAGSGGWNELDGAYQGGMIKRRYQGGSLARRIGGGGNPNRDSMLTLTQPGEWVMSKSAVSMIGEDKLSELNSRGNRRFSEAPPKGDEAQGEAPVINVWVVTPDQQQGSMGPNDVVVAVADNMMRGGSIKQLVKQIVAGTV